MLPRNHPDRIKIAFDDHRLVANAGLLLPATLAEHLGLGELVDNHVDLGDAPGRANTGDKLMTLVASALAGGDCIDDADVLRTGRTAGGGPGDGPLTIDLDSTHVRDLRAGQARGPAAGGPCQHRSGRRPLPAGDGGTGAPCRSHRTTHGARRQRLLRP